MSKKAKPEPDIDNPPPGFSVSEVADLLLEGHRPTHVKQRLEAEGMSKDAADDMLWEALAHIIDDASCMGNNAHNAWLVAAGRMVFRKQLANGDHSGCVSTLKALSGFRLPMPLQDDDPADDDLDLEETLDISDLE